MSFVLPGNARSLRFSGEAKAVDSAEAEEAEECPTNVVASPFLGKPRFRKPAPPPPPPMEPLRRRTPATEVRIASVPDHPPAPYAAVHLPPARPRMDSFDDDESPTTAMDRDGLDVMPGGRAVRAPRSTIPPKAIPGFRAHTEPPPAMLAPQPIRPRRVTPARPATIPYAVWVVASILAGILSYHVAPEVLARIDTPAHRR